MNPSPLLLPSTMFRHSLFQWLRWGAIAMLGASVGLLCVTIVAYRYRTTFAAHLIPSLLAALSVAVFLNFYSLWHLRRENQVADRAFRDTDCEFSSIFQNVLDGILIVNNEGTCMDANPAAVAVLRLSID